MWHSFSLAIPDVVQLQAQRTGPKAFLSGGEQDLSRTQCPMCPHSAGPGHQEKARVAPRSSGAQQSSERLTVKCCVCQPAATAVCHVRGRNESESLLGLQYPEFLLATPGYILWVGDHLSTLRQPPGLLAGWEGGIGQEGERDVFGCSHCQVIAALPS